MNLEKIHFGQILEKGRKVSPIIPPKVYQLWVKKIVNVKAWNDHYQYNNSYCLLQKNKEGVVISSLVANPELENGRLLYPTGVFPSGCFPLSDEEILRIDSYRRACRTYPFPCEIVDNEKQTF